MDRIVKGIWIPIEIWQNDSLSWNEKILLMEIDSFTAKGQECYISNEYIAEFLGVTDRCARKYLSHLIDLGAIRVVKFDGRKRYVESTISFQAEWNDCSGLNGTSVPHTNNIDNKVGDINISSLSYKKGGFVKPSFFEVQQYIAQRGSAVDAEAFYAYYESNGWKVGRNPMRDWKQAVITWERREQRPTPTPPRKESWAERQRRNLEKISAMYAGEGDVQ